MSYNDILCHCEKEPLSIMSGDDNGLLMSLTDESLKNLLEQCVFSNDIDSLNYVMTHPKLPPHHLLNDAILLDLIDAKYLDMFKYLTSSPAMKSPLSVVTQSGALLRMACRFNEVAFVEYLTCDTHLNPCCDVNDNHGEAFVIACESDAYDVVAYFMGDNNIRYPLIDEQAVINGMVQACERGHLNVIQQVFGVCVSTLLDHMYFEMLEISYENGHGDVMDFLLSTDISSTRCITQSQLFSELFLSKNQNYIKGVMRYLMKTDVVTYCEWLPKVLRYCEHIGRHDIRADVEKMMALSSPVTEENLVW